ncbi:MAG: tRNA lysidine(34) synthetase TilS [Bacteroidetes bacterium]|nr:MAG: tRNA lysidine(34) synthetase TilS [Bacteroidota bacterium]
MEGEGLYSSSASGGHRLIPGVGLRILNTVRAFVEQHGLFGVGDRLLLTVSGGRDSMALLSMAERLRVCPLAVAHCNFGLRGEESDGDEELVRGYCEARGLRLHSIGFDTLEYAKRGRMSIEEAARSLRYAWFEELAVEHGYTRIATAHHQQDQAETVLFNMARGAGISGMKGIPLRNGRVVRPLLCLPRRDIDAWCAELGVPYRDDQTNAQRVYTRNYLRHEVLPMLERVNPLAVDHLASSARYAREAHETLRAESEGVFGPIAAGGGFSFGLTTRAYLEHEGLARFWLRERLASLGFSAGQVDDVLRMVGDRAQTGRGVEGVGYRAVMNRGVLSVEPLLAGGETVEIPAEGSWAHLEFRVVVLADGGDWRQLASDGALAMDADRVGFPLSVRRWRAGDRFYPLGMGGRSKKLSDYLTDRRISGERRTAAEVLVAGERIACVLATGHIADWAAVSAGTRRLLLLGRVESPRSEGA